MIIYLSIFEIKRFGDIDLAGKLNNADLCPYPLAVLLNFQWEGPFQKSMDPDSINN